MSPDHDLVAAALPLYEVEGELGRGAWGVVLAGRHRSLGRDVAIKQLPRDFGQDPAVRSRFVTEARLLASLEHPHIVPIYDFVEHEGLCLVVMERLRGGTVWSRAKRGGFSPESSCAVILATCAALQYAHERGVLHRDIKPENMMFSGKGDLKVTDFGIAKVVGGAATVATRAGDVLGTPAYMAPEQAVGGELTPGTDVYAVGTVLYELLSGRLPFPEDSNPIAMLYKHVHEEPESLKTAVPTLPAQLADVVARSLAKDPEVRYRTAEEMAVAVAEAAAGAWGPGWLPSTGMTVAAAGRVLTAAMGHSTPRVAETAAPISLRETPGPAEADPAGDLISVTELEADLEAAKTAPTYEEPRPAPTDRQTGAPARQTVDAPAVLTPTIPGPGDAGGGAGATIASPPPAPPPAAPAAAVSRPAPQQGRRWGRLVAGPLVALLAVGVLILVIHHRRAGGTIITTRVTVEGNVAFTDTGVDLKVGDRILITATGKVNPATDQPPAVQAQVTTGPNGIPNNIPVEVNDVLPNLPHSGLIGRIGPNPPLFNVGARFIKLRNTVAGRLFLGINDKGLENNSGAFIAVIEVRRPRR